MADSVYRFLPWTRRGLAAAIPAPGPALPPGPVVSAPLRPSIDVAVTVSGVPEVTASATLNGPGDVVGIDQSQIVRVTPAANTTDAEPNFLAAVDFDAPELPWLFTPHGVPSDGRLTPWIVLVVVEDRSGVTLRQQPGWPLPRLAISSGAGQELPDLADAWAWAHVQVLDAPSGTTAGLEQALLKDPDRNVARLVCPRRLKPNARWIAAVVPAFDAGVTRGLGGLPQGTTVAPAWSNQDSVTLPVYYSWRFQTGPEGDFESLARRLKPHKASTTVGAAPMFVGDAGPAVRVPATDTQMLDMDGALRAPAAEDGRLSDVPAALIQGLTEVTRVSADAADGLLDGALPADDTAQPVGPPVYASAHVRRWKVQSEDATWFREMNLDPRPRAAGWLGGEIVRTNQEDIMAAAWSQVGDVLAAEAALQRAALSRWAAAAFYRRSIAVMADDRLLTLIAPLAAVTPFASQALTAALHATSMPDAVLDSGLRRCLAPSGRVVQQAAHRAGVSVGAVRPGLVTTLAAGTEAVDPTRFDRPALSADLGGATDAAAALQALGLSLDLPAEQVAPLLTAARGVQEATVPGRGERLAPRADLAATGVPGQAHRDAARRLADATAAGLAVAGGDGPGSPATLLATGTGATLDGILTSLAEAPGGTAGTSPGVGLLIEAPRVDPATGSLGRDARPEVDVLDIDRRGTLVVRTPGAARNIPVATIGTGLTAAELGPMLARLPGGALNRPGRPGRPGGGRRTGVEEPGDGELPTITVRGIGARRPGSQPRISERGAGRVRRDEEFPGVPVVTRPGRPGRGVGRPGVTGSGPTPVGPGTAPVGTPEAPVTVTTPPLLRDPATLARLEAALEWQASITAVDVATPAATVVSFDLGGSMMVVRDRTDPMVVQPLRRDALIQLAGKAVGQWGGIIQPKVDGWWATRAIDRVMAYPTFPVPAYQYLAAYDRTRFCPGVDEVPAESITLLETNPRFIAGFMVGLNHEANRELLWRGYPSDARGTAFRNFWARLDGGDDIEPIHGWRTGSLAQQAGGESSLVLLLRGDLLRRYPHTLVVAVKAESKTQPSRAEGDIKRPIFAGRFDPDVSFFGFDLTDDDLGDGEGWFFALMEPMTEPRFGLDETDTASSPSPSGWQDVGWGDTGVAAGGLLSVSDLQGLAAAPSVTSADRAANALFQHPFALYVHADHLLSQ